MTTKRYRKNSRVDPIGQVVGFLLLALTPVLALVGPQQQFSDLALVCGLVSIVLVSATAIQMRVPLLEWLLTPLGIMVGFMALAVGAVPVLWTLSFATPWTEVLGREHRAAFAGLLMFLAFCLGAWLALPRLKRAPVALRPNARGLTIFLWMGLIVGLLGYLLLAGLAGGPLALLHSLADRRESLAGTGPVRSVLMVSAVACIVGVLHPDKTRRQQNLTWACGISYFALTLLTGARFQALVVAIAAFAAYVRVHGSTRSARRAVTTAVLLVVPASTAYGLRVRTGLTYDIDVQVVDSSSATTTVASLLDPFVRGGVDSLRTLGAVADRAPTLDVNLLPMVGSLTNVIPRSLWPNKPEGSATVFSARYFPERWAQGTGVPPSISAELLDAFGFAGGVVAMGVLGFLVAKLTARVYASTGLFALVVFSFLTADALQFVKGGTDGFARSIALQGIAILITAVLARSCGVGGDRERRVPRPRPTSRAMAAPARKVPSDT